MSKPRTAVPGCPLCDANDEPPLLWRGDVCRVVVARDLPIPGFVRVVANRHAGEMTDFNPAERHQLLAVVFAVEGIIRRHLSPDKVNLASLGNMVPHVHWHIVPRWRDDPWFPHPVWSPALRGAEVSAERHRAAEAMCAAFASAMASALAPA